MIHIEVTEVKIQVLISKPNQVTGSAMSLLKTKTHLPFLNVKTMYAFVICCFCFHTYIVKYSWWYKIISALQDRIHVTAFRCNTYTQTYWKQHHLRSIKISAYCTKHTWRTNSLHKRLLDSDSIRKRNIHLIFSILFILWSVYSFLCMKGRVNTAN